MRVLVTGGTGFVGLCLVKVLIERGINVRILSRKKHFPNFFQSDLIEIINGDLINPECPLDILSDCSVVFNCAGEIRDERRMADLHIGATSRLIIACKAEARRSGNSMHWVQLSSVGAYGGPLKANEKRVVTEDFPLSPMGPYEVTKAEADRLVIAAAETGVFTYSILRPSNIYGAGMPNNSLRQWIRLIEKRLFFYVGNPGAIATYVHVDDVVEALVKCGFDNRAKGEVFNISNDCLQTDIVKALAKARDVRAPILRLPEILVRVVAKIFARIPGFPLSISRVNALVSRTHYPVNKLKSVLEFSPKRNVTATIAEITE